VALLEKRRRRTHLVNGEAPAAAPRRPRGASLRRGRSGRPRCSSKSRSEPSRSRHDPRGSRRQAMPSAHRHDGRPRASPLMRRRWRPCRRDDMDVPGTAAQSRCGLTGGESRGWKPSHGITGGEKTAQSRCPPSRAHCGPTCTVTHASVRRRRRSRETLSEQQYRVSFN
jgi:hypothetical protein